MKQYDVLILLSGPEPQRTFLEQKLLNALQKKSYSVLLVRGMADDAISAPSQINVVNHLSNEELNFHLLKSKYIVCRSGYSSIMDLAATGRSAVIIPTPGQTEQEYLAELHHLKHHYAVKQNDFNLEEALEQVNTLEPLIMKRDIKELVSSLLKK